MTITTPAHHHPNSDDFADFPLRGPPRSSVIQLASKELDVESPRFVPGAQAGLIALRFGRDEAKAASSFPFIPFASESEFGIYEPPVGTQRGARVDVVDVKPAEARWETNSNGKRECRLPNGYLVKESRILYMIVGGQGRLLPHPFVRPFADFRLARSLPAFLGQASWGDEAHPRAVGQQVEDGDARTPRGL